MTTMIPQDPHPGTTPTTSQLLPVHRLPIYHLCTGASLPLPPNSHSASPPWSLHQSLRAHHRATPTTLLSPHVSLPHGPRLDHPFTSLLRAVHHRLQHRRLGTALRLHCRRQHFLSLRPKQLCCRFAHPLIIQILLPRVPLFLLPAPSPM